MSLNSYDVTKQSVVYGMFNQFVFNEVKTNIDLIERYFLTDSSTMGNNLIKGLLDAIRDYEFSAIDEPLFRSILAGQGKTDNESNDILKEIVRYKMYDTYQIDPIRKYIRGIGNQSLITKALNKYPNDPESYVKYIKSHDYKADYSDVFTVLNFDDLDINTITAESAKGFKSDFNFINQSFQPSNMYEAGQIVLVSAPPGCFTGDTMVRLIDGTGISMKELYYSMMTSRREYKTYCMTSDGEVKVTSILRCWISKEVDKLVVVSTKSRDGRISINKCTGDHRFLLKDNVTYKEAKDLVSGEELSNNLIVSSIDHIDLGLFNTQVYDLEVDDESHNFMLHNGEVFVHNCGKTLFCITECLNMCINGARCHYLALGDMKQKDFVQRMGAIYSGNSFGDTMLQLHNIYPRLREALGGRFELTILPAATVKIDDYIDYMLTNPNRFDVLFIDYDSNFLMSQSDNMYKEGGYIYDKITKLTQLGKLVFICSQPKIGSWNNVTIELSDIGESSRKVHSTDVLITISKGGLRYNPNHLGRMKIPKNRRGEEGIEVPYIRLNNGRFKIITENIYAQLIQIEGKRYFTDADINLLISNELNSQSTNQNNVSQPKTSQLDKYFVM